MTSGVVLPVGSGHPYTSDEGNKARDEDGSTASKELVQGCVGPASDGSRAQIRRPIEQAFLPFVCNAKLLKVKFLEKRQMSVSDREEI